MQPLKVLISRRGCCQACGRTGSADHERFFRAVGYSRRRPQRRRNFSLRSGATTSISIARSISSRVSSYGNRPSPTQELKSGWDSTGEVKLTKDMDQTMKDRNIILVEDILDTGLTMTYLKKLLMARQREVPESCVPARQTLAPQTAAGRRLCGFQDPGRICGRIWPRLRREVSQSRRHLHCPERVAAKNAAVVGH